MTSVVGDDRALRAARRFGGAGRVAGGDFDAQRGAEVDGHDRVAGFAGQFDRAAVGATFVAAQPLVAEAGGGTGPFAAVCPQFLPDLGAAADRRRAVVYRAQLRPMALPTPWPLSPSMPSVRSTPARSVAGGVPRKIAA